MTILTIFNFIRKYYWIVQAVVIVALFLLLRKEKQKTDDYQEIYQLKQREVEIWRDDAGKNRIRAEIAEIDAANAKLVLESNLKETIRKEVGNLKRNLISYSSVRSSTSGTFQTGSVDTVYLLEPTKALQPISAKKFTLNNPDLKFKGLYVPSLDTLFAEYKVVHNFEVFHYYKRPGKPPFNIFRRKQAVAEIRFDNPNTQGDSLYSVVLERKKGLWKALFGRK
ncbi:hypothetical protein GCM10009122_33240 [Fulvivirga kasyanovii]|uniref:Uncharacterized protein n=1 Tax=Fulvivirga kasyanovii TaxID=396812 RepID=A0ABW9RJL2_9BACT|nr:hypothetical protein [Fulvivirga kasyanovii]MBT31800.1 hypothetical protein [Thalassovita sp.]MTI24272.1 hypothetical protein [Fulvivirga kasyanovii]HNP17038.1 hypothetical protein [Fulvivirga sp.]